MQYLVPLFLHVQVLSIFINYINIMINEDMIKTEMCYISVKRTYERYAQK